MSNATEWDRNALRAMLRAHGVVGMLEAVRETVEEAASPEGAADATEESNRCYVAASLLDEVLEALEKV